MLRNLILIALGLAFCLEGVSQEITFSRPQKLNSKVDGYRVIGKTAEGILIHKFGAKYHEVEAFDTHTLRSKWQKEFKLKEKNVRVIDIIPLKRELLFIYSHREKSVTRIYARKYSNKLKPISEELLIVEDKRKFGGKGHDFELAHNKSRTLFAIQKLNKGSFGYESAEVFLINKDLKKLREHTFPIEKGWKFKALELSVEGKVYFCRVKYKRTIFSANPKYEDLEIVEYDYHRGIEKRVLINDNEFLLSDLKMEIDELNGHIILGGFYSERENKSINGYFYANVDQADMTLISKRFNVFDDDFIRKASSVTTIFGPNNEIENVEIKKVMLRSDGGALLIGEAFSESVNTTNSNNFFNDGFSNRSQEVINYYYYDVIAVSVNPDGSLDWNHVLKKKQYSTADAGYFSSFGIANTRDQLHFLFNEEISKKTNISEFLIGFEGDYKIKSLMNAQEYNLSLAPRYAKQISSEEVVIPTFNSKNEFMITKLQY